KPANDFHQRGPIDKFADDKRPSFENSGIQNLGGAELSDSLRRGDLLQEAAPDPRIGSWRQELERRAASSGIGSQEHHALPAFAQPPEQPLGTDLTWIRITQRQHTEHCGPGRLHQAILPRRTLACRDFLSPGYAPFNPRIWVTLQETRCRTRTFW